ncbi:esterase/lipase family protein [Streptomyces sp. enrichment culture]|uniref:esterase/lipase family protein n=1 Tax=Streptomyces sp. enrichment culture TaxID=1795815 RepID=UPI003F54BEC9
MKKYVLSAVVSTLLAFTSAAPVHAADPSTFGPSSHPVLFVHGYSSSGSYWSTMADAFRTDGWPSSHLDQWSYDWRQSNAATAQQLAAEVDRLLAATGASKVDIVSHSMGGLSSRYYAKNLGGSGKIDAWVSLAGPNHGTDWANGCGYTSCFEMRIGSAFLTSLNSGDETPGTPRYGTWWSPCDTIINPDSSVPLSGAVNTRTACLGHNAIGSDPTVYGQVRDFVNS